MAQTNFPRPPLGYTALRRELRGGLSQQARQIWWPSLPRIPDGEGINAFSNVSELAANRYKWANADTRLDPNTSIDVKAAYAVQLLTNQYQLFDKDFAFPLSRILVRELADVSLVFSMMCDIMDRGDWFFPADAAQQRVRFETFRMLCERNNPLFYQSLTNINALEDKHLDIFFVKLFVDVLPDDSVKKLMDIYFYEGIKTIYRFGIAFLILSAEVVNPTSFNNGNDYWKSLLKNKTENCPSFFSICNFANDIGKSIFSRKCVPARATISKMEGQARIVLMGRLGNGGLKAPLTHAYSMSEERVDAIDAITPQAHDLHLKSQILDLEMSKTLQSFLTNSISLEGFELMFATHADGWDLSSLYNRVDKLNPSILLIQARNGAVFGAFLSTDIGPASSSPKGDGRCFIFRLNGSHPNCYKWSSATPSGHTHCTHHQYFVAARDYLSVGADSATATCAIRLDENMHNCDCGFSDTYENRVSLVHEHTSMTALQVAEVEVLCGRASVLRSGKAPHIIPPKR